MNLRLVRNQFRPDGIFGEIIGNAGKILYFTLEHSYLQDDKSTYKPKLPNGVYTCKKGQHQLHSMNHPFTAFEIMNVPGHTNILIHVGNFNRDSEGCVLLGAAIAHSSYGQMITNSKVMFAEFMDMQNQVDSFQLTVE